MHFCAKAAKEEQRNGAVQKLIVKAMKRYGSAFGGLQLGGGEYDDKHFCVLRRT
jgi:hypothetical protein